ncbi:ABC transporter permease [Thermocoleostomius sinensis]|uniref:Iron export ABC transporter permease subunit FetB n=1 Tax=Thermocoleostomius sinensis A174 TaxID=2016057 RepID=A0A9E9C809_9CYAN|nr:iron export ABC transporter permease subunit FetB [Thermocoleostomius sinensis]WAL59823.1 iron export ABC transporter permease subunit FetB [Thermocoleostomius sinensis A174]
MNDLIEIDLIQFGWALGLMGIAIGLSAWQQLGLEWNLAVATFRTVIQLLAIGYILDFVFALNTPWAVIGIIGIMAVIAAIVARNRISQKVPRLLPIVGGSILIGTALTLSYVILLVLQPDPWFQPQYLVPLAGIILGNAMNAAAIGGERLVSTLNASRLEIETHLSLGATPRQATAAYRREAIKAGLIPTLNSMMVVGIVTLPGIITGQILSGINPLDAAIYQMLIMFILAIATLGTTMLLVQGIYRQFFNQAAQFIPH